jgi:hypothetical protein
MLSMVPAAIPSGEAEAAAKLSVSRFSDTTSRPLDKHDAHAIVTLRPWDGSAPQDGLLRLSWAVAAIAKASGALGVYWGNGSVAHAADFFIEGARDSGRPEDAMLLPLWLGISVAPEANGISFLTLGVQKQFTLPELKLWSPLGGEWDALNCAFNLVSYIIGRGTPVVSGETVGRTTDERLVVRYEPSPIGRPGQVMCVDLPGKRAG